MPEFANSWKRVAGIVILAVACLFMIAWLRSGFVQDSLIVPLRSDVAAEVISGNGRIVFALIKCESRAGVADEGGSSLMRKFRRFSHPAGREDYYFHFSVCGLLTDLNTLKIEPRFSSGPHAWNLKIRDFPYWSVTLPLALTSAWLLLNNSCKDSQRGAPHMPKFGA